MLKKSIFINFSTIALVVSIVISLFIPTFINAQTGGDGIFPSLGHKGINDGILSFIDTEVTSVSFNENTRELSIDVEVENTRDIFVDEVQYSFELFQGDQLQEVGYVFKDMQYILTETGDFEDLYPQETLNTTVTYVVPDSVPQGNYFIRFLVFDEDRFSFGMSHSTEPLRITGDGTYIPFVRASVIDAEGEKRASTEGSHIEKNQTLGVLLERPNNVKLFNTANRQDLFYRAEIYRANDLEQVVDRISRTPLKPSNGKIEIDIEPYSDPAAGPHEARFYVENAEGEQVTEYFPIRYTYEGLTARITEIQTYFNAYERGANLDLEVEFAYAGGQNSDFINVNATVITEDGVEYEFTRQHNLRPGWRGQVIDQEIFHQEELRRGGQITQIEVQIIDQEGNVLDTETLSPDTEVVLERERGENTGAIISALVTIGVIILIVVIIVLVKKHSKVSGYTAIVLAAFLFATGMIYIAPQIDIDILAQGGGGSSSEWSADCTVEDINAAAHPPNGENHTVTLNAGSGGDYAAPYEGDIDQTDYQEYCTGGQNGATGSIQSAQKTEQEGAAPTFAVDGTGEYTYEITSVKDADGEDGGDASCTGFVAPKWGCEGCSSDGKIRGGGANALGCDETFFVWGDLDKGANQGWVPDQAQWEVATGGSIDCTQGTASTQNGSPKSSNWTCTTTCSYDDVCLDDEGNPVGGIHSDTGSVTLTVSYPPESRCDPEEPNCDFTVQIEEDCGPTPPNDCVPNDPRPECCGVLDPEEVCDDDCPDSNDIGTNVIEQYTDWNGGSFEGNVGACQQDGNPTQFNSYVKFECPTDNAGATGSYDYEISYWHTSDVSGAPAQSTGSLTVNSQDTPGINTWILGPFSWTFEFQDIDDNYNVQDYRLLTEATFPQNSYCVAYTEESLDCDDIEATEWFTRPITCTTPGNIQVDVWYDEDADGTKDLSEEYFDDSDQAACGGSIEMDIEVSLADDNGDPVGGTDLNLCDAGNGRAYLELDEVDPGDYTVTLTQYDDSNYEITTGGAQQVVTIGYGIEEDVSFGLDLIGTGSITAECPSATIDYKSVQTQLNPDANGLFLVGPNLVDNDGTSFTIEWDARVTEDAGATGYDFELDVLSLGGIQDTDTAAFNVLTTLADLGGGNTVSFADTDYGTETVFIDVEDSDGLNLTTQLECSVVIGDCITDADCTGAEVCSTTNLCEVPPPDVEIEMEPTFINEAAAGADRCEITTTAWFYELGQSCDIVETNTDNVVHADLDATGGGDSTIPQGGEEEVFNGNFVGPGSYRAKCYTSDDSEFNYSNVEICTANPNIREF
jgi:L-fucose mutarotase/ribose pyranase (RbsD/FucU family)